MRHEPDYFEDHGRELVLLYIAKKLKHALAIEKLLTEAVIDYHVEVDNYVGGIIFRSERAGAFIYVAEDSRAQAAEVIAGKGFTPISTDL
jgi:hypothetical protein